MAEGAGASGAMSSETGATLQLRGPPPVARRGAEQGGTPTAEVVRHEEARVLSQAARPSTTSNREAVGLPN